MERRLFLSRSMLVAFLLTEPRKSLIDSQGLCSEKETPALEPVNETHFPDRLHLFVWRNWELVNTERLAQVLGTTPDKVLEIGAAMGLPKMPRLSRDQLRRLYITVIRQQLS